MIISSNPYSFCSNQILKAKRYKGNSWEEKDTRLKRSILTCLDRALRAVAGAHIVRRGCARLGARSSRWRNRTYDRWMMSRQWRRKR